MRKRHRDDRALYLLLCEMRDRFHHDRDRGKLPRIPGKQRANLLRCLRASANGDAANFGALLRELRRLTKEA